MATSFSDVKRIYPFTAGAAAAGTELPSGSIALTDLSPLPRFGLKGLGSMAWLAGQGIDLPAVNSLRLHDGMLVLRLGEEDIVLLGEDAGDRLEALQVAWERDTSARGYSSWREEGWAWMRLSGMAVADAMARLCAVDLRPDRFATDEIAQTRVGGVEAVTFRCKHGFDVLFDIAASAYFARTVTAVAHDISRASVLHGEP